MKSKEIHLDSNKQEITKTISGFPVSCYYSEFTADTYDFIDWHWHVEFQLCLTTRGTVIWGTESQKDLVPTGDGIFINSQRVHTARPLGKEAAFFCVDIPPDFLCPEKESSLYEKSVRPVLEEAGLDKKVIDHQTLQGFEILTLLSKMASAFDAKADGYEFDLVSGVFSIWKNIREYLGADIKNSKITGDDRFRKILMYLQKNYDVGISLDEIADYIGLSRSECCRYFKRKSGQTISDYLRQYRIHKSLDLLIETDDPISQIAQNCGFSNQSYYTKEFRKQTGITPKQYRLRQKANLSLPVTVDTSKFF